MGSAPTPPTPPTPPPTPLKASNPVGSYLLSYLRSPTTGSNFVSYLGGVPLLLGVGVAGVTCWVNPAPLPPPPPMEEEEPDEWPGDPEPDEGVAGVRVV